MINRRDFMALIPSLGALPFIGKEIIKEDKRIIIEEPKIIESTNSIPDVSAFDNSKLTVLLCYDGKVIGSANRSEVGISSGIIEEAQYSLHSSIYLNPRLELKCSFDNDQINYRLFESLRK